MVSRIELFRKIADPRFLINAADEFVSKADILHSRKAQIVMSYREGLNENVSRRQINKIFEDSRRNELIGIIEEEEDLFKRFFRHFRFLNNKKNQEEIFKVLGDKKRVRAAFEVIDEFSKLLEGHLFKKSNLMQCLDDQKKAAKGGVYKDVITHFIKERHIYERFSEPLEIATSLTPIIQRAINLGLTQEPSEEKRAVLKEEGDVVRKIGGLGSRSFARVAASVLVAVTLFVGSLGFVGKAEAAGVRTPRRQYSRMAGFSEKLFEGKIRFSSPLEFKKAMIQLYRYLNSKRREEWSVRETLSYALCKAIHEDYKEESKEERAIEAKLGVNVAGRLSKNVYANLNNLYRLFGKGPFKGVNTLFFLDESFRIGGMNETVAQGGCPYGVYYSGFKVVVMYDDSDDSILHETWHHRDPEKKELYDELWGQSEGDAGHEAMVKSATIYGPSRGFITLYSSSNKVEFYVELMTHIKFFLKGKDSNVWLIPILDNKNKSRYISQFEVLKKYGQISEREYQKLVDFLRTGRGPDGEMALGQGSVPLKKTLLADFKEMENKSERTYNNIKKIWRGRFIEAFFDDLKKATSEGRGEEQIKKVVISNRRFLILLEKMEGLVFEYGEQLALCEVIKKLKGSGVIRGSEVDEVLSKALRIRQKAKMVAQTWENIIKAILDMTKHLPEEIREGIRKSMKRF